MPSKNKTENLHLNYWLGGDKPKKDNFNSDNLKIDKAVHELAVKTDEQGALLIEALASKADKQTQFDISLPLRFRI